MKHRPRWLTGLRRAWDRIRLAHDAIGIGQPPVPFQVIRVDRRRSYRTLLVSSALTPADKAALERWLARWTRSYPFAVVHVVREEWAARLDAAALLDLSEEDGQRYDAVHVLAFIRNRATGKGDAATS